MIETTIPEINVSELMVRVRAKAAAAQKMPRSLGPKEPSASRGPNLPSLEIVPPPPALILPQPRAGRKERILSMLAQARQSTQVSRWVPKPVRRFFRKQGGYNRMLLESVGVLAKSSDELARRLEQLTACVQVQHEWLGVLQRRSEQESAWMNTAAQTLGAVSGEIHRVNQKVQEQSGQMEHQVATRLSEWRTELDGIGKHLRNLQFVSERSSVMEVALQKGQDELLSGFRHLRADSEHSANHVRNLQKEVDRNSVLLKELENVRSALESTPEHIRKLQQELERHAAAESILQRQQEELSNGFQSLRSVGERTGEHLRNLQGESFRSGVAAEELQRQFDGLASGSTALTRQVSHLEERITAEGAFLRAQLSHHASLLQPGPREKADTNGLFRKFDTDEKTPVGAVDERFDAFYMSFEDRFRGPRDEIKERISFYLPYIWENNAGAPDLPVLDLGCGRGEWLELLQEIGVNTRGVDINSAMLALCRQRGLDVIQADALEYLRSLPDNSQSAVTGFHIIEHLGFATLMDVLTEAHRVVAPGGLVIFESPNCKNLIVGACNFNIDPTHRNPVFPDTAKFMLDRVGFERIEIEYLTPITTTSFDGNGADQPVLKELLYGPQDFAVIGYKAPAS